MNIFLWILQVTLALHTLIGAVWKLSNSEQSVTSLSAIPHVVWIGLIVVEVFCSFFLVLPIFKKSLGFLAPIAAISIAIEMLFFCALNLYSGAGSQGEIIYWLIVAALCAFIAYGRLVLKPL